MSASPTRLRSGRADTPHDRVAGYSLPSLLHSPIGLDKVMPRLRLAQIVNHNPAMARTAAGANVNQLCVKIVATPCAEQRRQSRVLRHSRTPNC
jgi:hypothetical protein